MSWQDILIHPDCYVIENVLPGHFENDSHFVSRRHFRSLLTHPMACQANLGTAYTSSQTRSISPDPIAHFRHIYKVGTYITMVLAKHIVALLDEWWRQALDAWRPLHGQDREMIAAHFVQHNHIKGCGGRALLIEAAYMETPRIGTPVDQLMNGSLITVEGENDGLIGCEVFDKGGVIQSMRMSVRRVERHQVDDIDHAYLQFRDVVT